MKLLREGKDEDWEKIFVNSLPDKGFKGLKERLKLKKKQQQSTQKVGKDLNKHLSKTGIVGK